MFSVHLPSTTDLRRVKQERHAPWPGKDAERPEQRAGPWKQHILALRCLRELLLVAMEVTQNRLVPHVRRCHILNVGWNIHTAQSEPIMSYAGGADGAGCCESNSAAF